LRNTQPNNAGSSHFEYLERTRNLLQSFHVCNVVTKLQPGVKFSSATEPSPELLQFI